MQSGRLPGRRRQTLNLHGINQLSKLKKIAGAD
jgi:hypothetical protein